MSKYNNYGLHICNECEDEIDNTNNSPYNDLCQSCNYKLYIKYKEAMEKMINNQINKKGD